MSIQELQQLVESDRTLVLDLRLGRAYSEGHLKGAVSAPFSQRGWGNQVAAWLRQQAPDYQVVLFGDNPVIVDSAKDALVSQGIEPSAVWSQGLAPWQEAGLPVIRVDNITVDALHQELSNWAVIDVREPYEHRSGVIPGALKIPLGQLPDHVSQLDPSRRYAIVCASGNRSQSAAAFMAEQGLEVANVVGGMSLWLGSGHPVER